MPEPTDDISKRDDIARHTKAGINLCHVPPGEEVVVSGMSGTFPSSLNLQEFKENLYNKNDMMTTNLRWDKKHPEIMTKIGRVPGIDRFDAGHFGVHPKQSEIMDPMCRLLLEKAVEAILDAGVHPSELEGTKTGVYIAIANSDANETWFRENEGTRRYVFTGMQKSTFAHRLSHHLNLEGPSHCLDSACCTLLYGIDEALKQLRNGTVDAAIVGGSVLHLHPHMNIEVVKMNLCSKDGTSKSFDDLADGYGRAETSAVVFLQRAKDARRIYAKIIHTVAKCEGFKEGSIARPSTDEQIIVINELFEQSGVTSSIDYVEAHGTGTKYGDKSELTSYHATYCKNRTKPLLLGTVKSNMGHAEFASALTQLAKIVFIFETGLIPPNLHFKSSTHPAIASGAIKVVTENTEFETECGMIPMMSFGYNSLVAVLYKRHEKVKRNRGIPSDDLPRLVCISGRTEECIKSFADHLKNNVLDEEFVALLHKIFKFDSPTHCFRGFSLVSKSTGEIARSATRYTQQKPPLFIWFGKKPSDCLELVRDLMGFDIFANTMKKVSNILESKGLSLKDVYSTNHVVLGVAFQMGILNLLKELGIDFDGVFGYSCGEMLQAYVKGFFTLEQTITTAYCVGEVLSSISDTMGADDISQFIAKNETLQLFGVPLINMDGCFAAEYFAKKVLRSKEEGALHSFPEDGVVLKVGKIEVDNEENDRVVNIFGVVSLLKAIGRIYELGYNPCLEKLYPEVTFPVSRATPMISPLIKWDHSKSWYVPTYTNKNLMNGNERIVGIDLREPDWGFVAGHVIDGDRVVFPATGYVFLGWETLAILLDKDLESSKVILEDLRFIKAVELPIDDKVDLRIVANPVTGTFEIFEGNDPVASGRAKFVDEIISTDVIRSLKPEGVEIQGDAVYKELKLRGYSYMDLFQGIKIINSHLTYAKIQWRNNWVTFLDNLLQLSLMQVKTRELFVPTLIGSIAIDAAYHHRFSKDSDDVPAFYIKETNTIRSGGVEIAQLNATAIDRRMKSKEPLLEKYVFVPNETELSLEESVRVMVQIIVENYYKLVINVTEEVEEGKEALSPLIFEAIADVPLIRSEITVLSSQKLNMTNVKVENKSLNNSENNIFVIASNLLQDKESLFAALRSIVPNGFVISREAADSDLTTPPSVEIITVHKTPKETLVLLKEYIGYVACTSMDVSRFDNVGQWLPQLKEVVRRGREVLIYSHKNPCSGILGFYNCVRREAGECKIRCVFMQDEDRSFDGNDERLHKQMRKDLTVNVFKNGKWGTYRHLKMLEDREIESDFYFVESKTGTLDSLKWSEGIIKHDQDKELVNVFYSGLSHDDALSATGKLNKDLVSLSEGKKLFGIEFAGLDSKGTKVMGLGPDGTLANKIYIDRDLLLPIPEEWYMDDAATVLLNYGVACYALMSKANVKTGQTILIHVGSSGIGVAAANIATNYFYLHAFVTVNSQKQKELVQEYLPHLTAQQIGFSKDAQFKQWVLKKTKGKGVDIVFNTLGQEHKLESLDCLSKGGKFLDITNGPVDPLFQLDLSKKQIVIHGINPRKVLTLSKTRKTLMEALRITIRSGTVKPFPRKCFSANELQAAFEDTKDWDDISKILIEVKKEEFEDVCDPIRVKVKGSLMFSCDPKGSYVITGGLGGLGLELAEYLVERGAKKLVLTSRTGVTNGYQAMKINSWETKGCEIVISKVDISRRDGCEQLLEEANALGPVVAIFGLAGLLLDASLDNQTEENFMQSLEPKALATAHLDELSRVLCPYLKDFVVYSSLACGKGNEGQSNYGLSNSIMERICEKRKEDGFPALAIQWGPLADVGLVANMQNSLKREMEIIGALPQTIPSYWSTLDYFLTNKVDTVVSSAVVAEKQSRECTLSLIDAVAQAMGINNLKSISFQSTLSQLGMDSAMATEVKFILEQYDIFLVPVAVRSLTFERLQEMTDERENKSFASVKVKGIHDDERLRGSDIPALIIHFLLRSIGNENPLGVSSIKLNSAVDDTCEEKVFFFPGMYCNTTALEPLAKEMRARVWCLQYDSENKEKTIQHDARKLAEEVKRLSTSKTFKFVAHSFGTVVSLETCAVLESEGYRGQVILLDGAPLFIKGIVRLVFGNMVAVDEVEAEINILTQVLKYLIADMKNFAISKEEMRKYNTLEERVDAVLDRLPSELPFSRAYARHVIIGTHKRHLAVDNYKPSFEKLHSYVKLFKPIQESMPDLPEDYGLRTVVNNNVDIQVIDGDHASIIVNPDLGRLVNQALEL